MSHLRAPSRRRSVPSIVVAASLFAASVLVAAELAAARPAVPPAPDPDATATAAAVDEALRALSPQVRRTSDPGALRTTFAAYYGYRAANPRLVTKPYLYFVDMGLDNRTPRGYVFDMDALRVVEGPFQVAHGYGSLNRDGVPENFSNRPGSNATSVGLYLAQETYTFRGKSGGRAYASVGLRMKGESGEFNDAARRRGIVAHGAPYVTAGRAGKSQGCPAMEQDRAARLLPLISDGGVVFIYSPHATRWLATDRWVASARLAGQR